MQQWPTEISCLLRLALLSDGNANDHEKAIDFQSVDDDKNRADIKAGKTMLLHPNILVGALS
jgi:hypothetical protein